MWTTSLKTAKELGEKQLVVSEVESIGSNHVLILGEENFLIQEARKRETANMRIFCCPDVDL